jgi:hydrogenase maturation protease
MKTLILALGNPILSDDGVGWQVADCLAERLKNQQADIIKSSAATMDIVPKLAGYDRLVIIDAIKLGTVSPGIVHRFSIEDFADTVRLSSPHDINFATAIQIGREWGYDIPADIRIYGIEAKELSIFSEVCTPEVSEKLEEVVEQILVDLISG